MNSKNLMIGDWVYVTSVCGWECEPIQQQIRGIEYSSFKGDDYCDWVSVDCDDEASLSHIEPIPLTAEILENNVFVKRNEKYTPNWNIYILNGNFFLEDRLDDCFHFNGNKIFRIKFVHELQHALRLCGLNDLADNFKI